MRIKGEEKTRRVWLDGKELFPGKSQKVYNHSPDGFNWGYGGSGPAQLALAICLEMFDHIPTALAKYQKFKWEVISRLHCDFEIEIDKEKI